MPDTKCGHGRGACCDACHTPGCKKKKVFTPKKKSPLDGIAAYFKANPDSWLAEELQEAEFHRKKGDLVKAEQIEKDFWAKKHRESAEREADEKAKRNRTGKYDPINVPLGKCRVCDGDIVEKLVWKSTGEMRIGGPSNSYRARDTLLCKRCGIKYAFVPGQKVETEDD